MILGTAADASASSKSWLTLTGNPFYTEGEGGIRQTRRISEPELLEALGRDGLQALHRIDGPFALAWWHAPSATLRLVRDRFGFEPLFFANDPQGLHYGSRASDVAARRASPPRVSPQGLVEFLTYCYVPGDDTLFDGVRAVPAGSVLELAANSRQPRVKRWYRLSFADPVPADEGAIATRYRELLEASVVARLDDSRTGVFLSGGMDSSSVATFARKHLPGAIHSFSFRCGGTSFDESTYARQLAEALRLTHTETEYGERESLEILEAVPLMDVPFCDIGIEIGTWLLARSAAGRVDYLLTGDGGDEIWASHPVYAAQRIVKWYDRAPIPYALRAALARGLNLVKDSDQKRNLAVVLKRILPPPAVPRQLGHFRWRLYHTPATLERLLAREAAANLRGADPFRSVMESFEGYEGPEDGMSIWLYSDYRTATSFYFSRLRLARHFGLEVRTPFYDRALVEYGARIPAHLKLEGVERTKRLFRVAMEGVLPDIINHRKDKLGHSVPLKNWLRGGGSLGALVSETLESERFLDRGLFKPEAVRQLIAEHGARRHNHSHRLWALFVLEHWLRAHIDQTDSTRIAFASDAA